MELKFKKTTCPCLRKAVCQVHTQEYTQEVRLPDAMPDIGRVLGSWGKILVRGKEWRGSGMSVSGGVMCWILYAPEDGTEPKSMEAWIPFQAKWEFPQAERDGAICVLPQLKSMDARSVSARKLMLRANVSILGEALEPVDPVLFEADSVPEDVELLKNVYPMELPIEAGEKQCQIEEELALPAGTPPVGKLLRYDLIPLLTEQKVLAGRLVFKGKAVLYMLYRTPEGDLRNWRGEVPFSQFADLDRDYSPGAQAQVDMLQTGLELFVDEQQRLQLKSGMAAQYVIYDRIFVELVEDAYSPKRDVNVQSEVLMLPVKLDRRLQSLGIRENLNIESDRILDVCCCMDHPHQQINEDVVEITVPYQFQTLYLDTEGTIQSASVRGEALWNLPSDSSNLVAIYLRRTGFCDCSAADQTRELSCEAELDAVIFAEDGLSMVTGLTLGEEKEPSPDRPSLILRKAGNLRLWDIAKECGSTVDTIRKVNGLEEEPNREDILLIPVS